MPANPDNNIPFGDVQDIGESIRLPTGLQVIIESYRFQCHGQITRWQTYVAPSGPLYQNGVYSIILQVWRPTWDGCYMQEAYDSYENIILNSSEGDLVNRTVNLSSTALSVQPGDVLGYYVETRGGRLEEGILLERRENGAGENVWYHNGPLKYSPLQCPFPAWITRNFRAAPVFTIDIGTAKNRTEDISIEI